MPYHDSDAYFENLDCLQQDTGENHLGDSSDDHNQPYDIGGSYDNTPSDKVQKAPAKEQIHADSCMLLATVKNCTVKAVFPVCQIISIYVSQIVNRVPKCKNR